jgi:hypothetical protein
MVSLDDRVSILERQVRTLKRFLFLALAAFVFASVGAGAIAQQKALTFTDASGTTRVKIDATGIQMYHPSGDRAMLLGFNSSGHPSLYLQDLKGNYKLGAYLSDDDQPVIRLADSNDKARAYFGLTSQAHMPRIEFLDAGENERLFVGLTTSATGLVQMQTASGTTQSQFGDDLINITDGNGNKRVYLGTSTTGDGIFRLYDASNHERIYAGTYTDGKAGFSAMNAVGTTTWASP